MLNLDQQFPIVPFDINAKVEEIPWVIRDFWQRGKINVMFGPEKSGKSRLLNWMLVNMLLNPACLDLAVEWVPKKVLYLAAEELTSDVNGRLLRYAGYAGKVPRKTILPVDFISASGMRLDFGATREWIERTMIDGRYDMVVVDPLRRVHGADENDNSAMARIFNDMRKWTNESGITLIMLHHTGKLTEDANYDRIATWSRGASDLAAILDTAQFVDRQSKTNLRVLRAGRFRPVDPLVLSDGLDDEYVFRRRLGK